MKLLLIVPAAICLGASFYFVTQAIPPPPPLNQAPLRAVTDRIELGRLLEGEVPNSRFELVNNSTVEVELRTVIRNCDCASVDLSFDRMKPGSTRPVKIAWNTKGRRGPSWSEIRVIYSVVGYPAETRDVALTLTGDISPRIVFQPERLAFSAASLLQQTRTVELIPADGIQAMVREAHANNSAFRVTRIADRFVDVTWNPANGSGLLTTDGAALIIKTTDDAAYIHVIPIRCELMPGAVPGL